MKMYRVTQLGWQNSIGLMLQTGLGRTNSFVLQLSVLFLSLLSFEFIWVHFSWSRNVVCHIYPHSPSFLSVFLSMHSTTICSTAPMCRLFTRLIHHLLFYVYVYWDGLFRSPYNIVVRNVKKLWFECLVEHKERRSSPLLVSTFLFVLIPL